MSCCLRCWKLLEHKPQLWSAAKLKDAKLGNVQVRAHIAEIDDLDEFVGLFLFNERGKAYLRQLFPDVTIYGQVTRPVYRTSLFYDDLWEVLVVKPNDPWTYHRRDGSKSKICAADPECWLPEEHVALSWDNEECVVESDESGEAVGEQQRPLAVTLVVEGEAIARSTPVRRRRQAPSQDDRAVRPRLVVSVPNDSEEDESPGLQAAPGLRRRPQEGAGPATASASVTLGDQDSEYEEDEDGNPVEGMVAGQDDDDVVEVSADL
jgi:hypothetical protein